MKLLILMTVFGLATGESLRAESQTLYVGTYTNTTSHGIYALKFNLETGQMAEPTLAAGVANPSFLAISPDRKALYAVDESAHGKVNAFSIDPSSDRLTALNSQSTRGNGPAHLAIDPSGRVVVATNYGGGSIASFPVAADHSLGHESAFFAHHGKLGPDAARQKAPHPHSVTFSRDGRYALVCDLGLDQVLIYRVDAEHGSIAPSEPAGAAVPPGAGARHSVFSADGHFLYVLNEMGGSVCVFAWDAKQGILLLQQTCSTLPEGYTGPTSSAEIALGHDGRFLYASNRGPNTITIFARDGRDGSLKVVDRESCGGDGPRNFVLSPNGRWLICANQQSNRVVVFKIDPETGKITPTGQSVTVGRPVCLVFSGR